MPRLIRAYEILRLRAVDKAQNRSPEDKPIKLRDPHRVGSNRVFLPILFAVALSLSLQACAAGTDPVGASASIGLPPAPGFSAVDSSDLASSFVSESAARMYGAPQTVSPAQAPISRWRMTIQPGEIAPSLTPPQKFWLGVDHTFTPFAAAGWFLAAGYSQLKDSTPNYGTDRGAFGERVAAAIARDTSEGFIGDAILSNVLREDPRYYRMGPGPRFLPRFFYAVTRPVVTRTDSGRSTPNFSVIAGNLGGAAITNVYYPAVNRGGAETMKTFGYSMLGSVTGDTVREFLRDALRIVHLGHN